MAEELTEQEKVIEEHIVRWSLEQPYCPAYVLARELAEALHQLTPE